MTPTPLAMHMANELLSLPVAAATLLLAAAAVALAARQARAAAGDARMPLMGVLGAFVFAAQMINFTLPGMPGTSGHLGGGVLLAILLGPAAGIVTMTVILIVQCLLFQDGGLLALGCNVINIGVVPCLLGWSVYRLCLGRGDRAAPGRQYLAAWLACLAGVVGGAAMVPFQAAASGVLRVPLEQFLAVMIGVHLVIGLCEGAITFAVLAYLRRTRPELLDAGDGPPFCPVPTPGTVPISAPQTPAPLKRSPAEMGTVPFGRLGYALPAASLLVTALLLAGVVSWFASTRLDGLEYSYREHAYAGAAEAVQNESSGIALVDRWQQRWSPLPDYAHRTAPLGKTIDAPDEAAAGGAGRWPHADGWRSAAGVLGTLVTLGLLYGASRMLRRPSHGHP